MVLKNVGLFYCLFDPVYLETDPVSKKMDPDSGSVYPKNTGSGSATLMV